MSNFYLFKLSFQNHSFHFEKNTLLVRFKFKDIDTDPQDE